MPGPEVAADSISSTDIWIKTIDKKNQRKSRRVKERSERVFIERYEVLGVYIISERDGGQPPVGWGRIVWLWLVVSPR